jgi:ATP-dependent RNA helicase RhlE
MKFEELGLAPPLLAAVKAAGYETPTPIQQQTIPAAIQGRDVLGCAQTGSGKTAAFCLPTLQRIHTASSDEAELRALILTPTRELAAQIGESLTTYGKNLELWHTVIFGGVSDKPQIAELKKGVDILVATPGRLLDLMNQRAVRLDSIELFILDEADRMLDMGFINDVRKITAKLPAKRQTLFFSATMPADIKKLADNLLTNPQFVAVDPVSSTVDTVTQSVYFTDKTKKHLLLVDLLKDPAFFRTIVFSRTKHGSDKVVRHLLKAGFNAAAIHGNKAQNARIRALEGFKAGKVDVLVATDIAARGIDVEDVSHVINYDLPNVPETYVHRIGRTARAGNSGIAISFCDAEERPFLRDIERLTAKRLTRVEDHAFLPDRALPELPDAKPGRRQPRAEPGAYANASSGGQKRGRRRPRGGRRPASGQSPGASAT